jgi:hypothetical protein
MLLCAFNRSEPAFASRRPQFISRREVCGRIVEGADSNFDLVDAVDKPKHGRPARGAKVTIVGGPPPARGLSDHRDLVRRPDRKKIAKRAGLLSTHETVAKTDSERLPADLKPHLTAVAATNSFSHVSPRLRINELVLLSPFHNNTLCRGHLFHRGGGCRLGERPRRREMLGLPDRPRH